MNLRTALSISGLLLFTQQPTFGQTWPARPIELTHGFAAGGNADTVARLIAAPLAEALGKPVQVVARPGAAGNVATEFVARAHPDGHTLLLAVGGHAVSAALYKKLPFDPVEDLSFVSTVSVNPFVIVVRKSSEIQNLADLIASAKRQPGKLTFSSAGIGSTQHLTGEMFTQQAGIQMTHVPYRGGSQPLTDLLGGTIDMMVDSITVTRGAIESGQVRALGVTSGDPWPSLPNVPTIQSVIPGFSVLSWIGVAAPPRMSPEIVGRLNSELKQILARPDIQQKLEGLGVRVGTSTPGEFRQLVSTEIARWSDIIAKAGIERQ